MLHKLFGAQLLGTILNVSSKDLVDNPHTSRLMQLMSDELASAGLLVGDTVSSFTREDVAKGLPDINDIIMLMERVLQEKQVSAPVTETIYELAKFKLGRWFHIFPNLAADVLVYSGDTILLIERKNEPYGWALPGGMVDLGETVEHAAVRELEEETGIKVTEAELTLLGVYSDPKRDSRGHTASVVYYAETAQTPVAADDAKNAKYFHINQLPELAFDHVRIIEDFLRKS